MLHVIIATISIYLCILILKMCQRESNFSNSLYFSYAISQIGATILLMAIVGIISPFFYPAEEYIGTLACDILSFCWYFFLMKIWLHSLLMSIMRYLYMVRHTQLTAFGISKADKMFKITSWLLPLYLSIVHKILQTEYDPIPWANLLYARSYNPDFTNLQLEMERTFCLHNTYTYDIIGGNWRYFFEEATRIFCCLHATVCLILFSNLCEAFMYWRIYVKLPRYAFKIIMSNKSSYRQICL